MSLDPQIRASDPLASVFVMANAGSGKTSTLVKRVARLLLRGAAPDAILCVTYTKAAAAEMQRRLFHLLGDWAVMEDKKLAQELAALDERADDLSHARALFARALETPGGLKIQTIHAFCEKLLKRFPLEAGVSPGFTVLEDAAAAEVSAQARDDVARFALEDEEGPLAAAYAYMSVQLDYRSFNAMFANFEARRGAIQAYVAACSGGVAADVWERCGFDAPASADALAAAAVDGVDWRQWQRAAEALRTSSLVTDRKLGEAMAAVAAGARFDSVWGLFCTQAGQPKSKLASKGIDAAVQDWLSREQARLGEACSRIKAARMAEETVHALTLASAYAALYEAAKTAHGGLDFADLIGRVRDLLTVRADAAWVLYKLDGGIDHILVDEAQDTAPDQWDIIRTLSQEFFAGAGSSPTRRTAFAVGDEKQSIYSFQGAAPERFLDEAREFKSMVEAGGERFEQIPLLESWRSAPEVLSFVDAVFHDPQAASGLRPGAGFAAATIEHLPRRDPGGAVDLWPLEQSEPAKEVDPWAPVDYEPPESANRKLARRIAVSIRDSVSRGEAVYDREARQWRPARFGDFLILVRRRNALFQEIIRALKRHKVAVGGADRLKLSEHVVFADLMALARFSLFPGDELTLAALLRSPFCDVDEDGLYDLAEPRGERDLWAELDRRAHERPAWSSARDFLVWARAEARRRPPFDFFSRALSRLDGEGRSMRSRMLTRLGREAEDALDAFLAEALKAEQRGLHDLESFVHAMASSEIEVKREQEESAGPAGGEVRVMTVHGAKGLEAPIVYLPDTTTCVTAQGGPLLRTIGGFLWAPRKADDCEASSLARDDRETAAQHESLRLLYVALTRARDRLVICGVQTQDRFYKQSWREVIDRALQNEAFKPSLRMVESADGAQVIRYGADPKILAANDDASAAPLAPPPPWARRLAAPEVPAARFASPSTLAEAEKGPAPSPLALTAGLGRYRRGELIHRLLQILPDLDVLNRPTAALALLEREQDLSADQRIEMADAALGVLNDERFADVFGPGSRAEVAIAGRAAGLPERLAVSGRVDRLVIQPDRVLVVDFKTNRPSPDRIEDADRAYLVQMAAYVAVLREVFPGRRVEAALVWTDGPKLMAIPEIIVARTLAELGQMVDTPGRGA